MEPIQKLHELGQSMWYDNIERKLLQNGELEGMIQRGDIRGVTSNPSIFNNAIARSSDYDTALKTMAWAGWNAEDIFYELAIEDIRAAADLFRNLYDQTSGGDGYVSLEVSPYLANDTEGTVREAQRLWNLVDRPNLMVKIPATMAGIPAIRRSIANGININVTLIFSIERYAMVMGAYMSGLEDRVKQGLPIGTIASVASFFVSRVDTKVDQRLEEIVRQEGENAAKARELLGKTGIANSRLAYFLFQEKFGSERFKQLQDRGGRIQRPLWASTSTKNPAYRDVMYVEELLAPDTVNTAPPRTIELFKDHGQARESIAGTEEQSRLEIEAVESLGISMEQVTHELEEEGVKTFADSFTQLIDTIQKRRDAFQTQLGPLQKAVESRVAELEENNAPERMHGHDPEFWTSDPQQQSEITNRLGWLDAPEKSRALLPELADLVQHVKNNGYTHALLLGMGGSSLAPEVMAQIFGVRPEGTWGLNLAILDGTDPVQVQAAMDRSPIERTLYIVSSKSGTTSEVHAFFNYFLDQAIKAVGEKAGSHFVAVTDPGTPLETLAKQNDFRQIFHANPEVGGRFSALTAFGLVPAALIGIDVKKLLDRAETMALQCGAGIPAGRNPGLVLGAIIGAGALQGRDKLTFLTDNDLNAFGSWLEQLVAESSGKQAKGIVPVDLEPPMDPKAYANDRLFVYIQKSGRLEGFAQDLWEAGQPVPVLELADDYDLGAEFYRWEVAIAIATAIIGVNGFNQPNVQSNKKLTKEMVETYRQTGTLDEGQPLWQKDAVQVFGKAFPGLDQADTPQQVVERFVQQAKSGDYIAINAYLPRNDLIHAKLQALRKAIQSQTGLATTLGFGPRFLHSTGQLHKGGPNTGVFLEITAEPQKDIPVPTEGISFGQLERAQALGDLQALLTENRRVIRINLLDGNLDKLPGRV